MKYRPSCFIGFLGGIFSLLCFTFDLCLSAFTACNMFLSRGAVNLVQISSLWHGKYRLSKKTICQGGIFSYFST